MKDELAPEFRLLCLDARRSPVPQELARVASLITDWSSMPAIARRHRVTQSVFSALRDHAADLVPQGVLETLRRHALTDHAVCQIQAVEIGAISQAFAAAGIDVLVLKGLPLSLGLYGNPAIRGIGDVDLLIDPAQLRHGDRLLTELGYLRQGAAILDSGQTACLRRVKDIAYRHHVTGQSIELHQRLTENPYLLPCDVPTLWRDRESVMLGGAAIATLPRRSLALYLCIHGSMHCWERLRWLVDLAELLHAPDALETALADADSAGLGRPMRQAVALCHHWLGLPVAAQELPCLDSFIHRFFSGGRWKMVAKPGSLEWLRRYSLWGRIHSWSLRSDWRYRMRELSSGLIWPPDWETIPLPDALFWMYPFLRPVGWALRRWQRKAS